MTKAVRMRRWLFACFAVVLILLELALILLVSGANAFVIGIVLAAVPIPLWIGLALWIERYEPEPPWLILAAFLWGAGVSTFFAVVANETGSAIISAEAGESASELYGGSVVAPVVEELLKGAFLFLIFFVRRDAINGVLDGIVYATVVGAGFAVVEDTFYYAESAGTEGLSETLEMFVYRGLLLGLSHPVFTALTGIGLGLLAANRHRKVFYVAPVVGLLAAIGLHAVNNSIGWGGLVFVLPAIVLMLVMAALSARREERIVRRHIPPELLSPEEAKALLSVRGRVSGFFQALWQGGIRGVRARDDYIRAVTEVAWHRYRAARPVAPPKSPSELERTYRERLRRVEELSA